MNGPKFKLEAAINGVDTARFVILSSEDYKGQQILFHFNRLFKGAIEKNDYKSIFRSLGMMSDEELRRAGI